MAHPLKRRRPPRREEEGCGVYIPEPAVGTGMQAVGVGTGSAAVASWWMLG
jgi:hypothetical protein